jgi:hypothetical protein
VLSASLGFGFSSVWVTVFRVWGVGRVCMVPLAAPSAADAAKLKRLGFKKTWWTSIKS